MGSDKPKKSCFNCTKRRIVCDLTPPKCKKCEKKGLECPGYGVRYRFTDGKTVSPSEIGPGPLEDSNAAAATSTRRRSSLKWVDVSSRVKKGRGVEIQETSLDPGQSSSSTSTGPARGDGDIDEVGDQTGTDNDETHSLDVWTSSFLTPVSALQPGIQEVGPTMPDEVDIPTSLDESDVIEVTRDDWLKDSMITTASPSMLNLPPLLSNTDPQIRLLFNHFSAHVSPVMLMYDDENNGYRHQILPLAHSNPIVERAVCVAAAFHLSRKMPELRLPAESGRAAIIDKLSTMSFDLSDSTWSTILLLIVADLITGHEHVLTLYKILVSFLDARGQAMGQHGLGGGSPLQRFLYYQSRVISFFAYPILGKSQVISDISHVLKDPDPLGSLEQFSSRQHLPLELLVASNQTQGSSSTLLDARTQLYTDIVREATEIYLLRANTSDNSSTLSQVSQPEILLNKFSNSPALDVAPKVATLRCLLEQVDPSTPGSHTIVWPAFVAAAESQSDNDRQFFTAVLHRLWDSTGYANVLKGLNALPDIWELQRQGRNWTSILPTLKTVVM